MFKVVITYRQNCSQCQIVWKVVGGYCIYMINRVKLTIVTMMAS